MLLMALVRGMSKKKAPDQASVSNAMQNFHNILLFAAVTCRLKKFEMKNEKINTFHKSKLTETNIQQSVCDTSQLRVHRLHGW